MASGFNIQKGTLPNWHDLYEKDSTDLVDLDDITVPITESDTTTYSYSSSSDYYKTTSWLCADTTLVGKNAPAIPSYLVHNKKSLIFKGCELNAPKKSATYHAIHTNGILTRTSDGQLKYNDEVIITTDAPYLLYFELAGAGGGGGGSDGNMFTNAAGSGGGSGSAIAGVLDFTKHSSFTITIGIGGNGGTGDTATYAGNGTASRITVDGYTLRVPGGFGGQGGGSIAGNGGARCKYWLGDDEINAGYLSNNRYYSDMGIFILGTTAGQAGRSSNDSTLASYGGSIPDWSTTMISFGTRQIDTGLNGWHYGTGGAGGNGAGSNASVPGGGGGGGSYKAFGNQDGGNGGNGIFIYVTWD